MEQEAKVILLATISSTLANSTDPALEWDDLKSVWRHSAVEAGRNIEIRLACELNETLRIIRILNAGVHLNATTRKFCETLR